MSADPWMAVDCSDCRRHLARCWQRVLEWPGRKVDDGIPMVAALAIAN